MFKRLRDAEQALKLDPVSLTVDGEPFDGRAGDTVAAVLFTAGIDSCRDTVVRGVPRGPFCMMGTCFDCLVTIDGKPNQQACMTLARAGMAVTRQRGSREIAS
jgi:predicted molibdopterin-dependent oxidoreductase YjgC